MKTILVESESRGAGGDLSVLETQRYLTPAECVRLYGRNANFWRRLLDRGHLRGFRDPDNGYRLIDVSHLHTVFSQCCPKPRRERVVKPRPEARRLGWEEKAVRRLKRELAEKQPVKAQS